MWTIDDVAVSLAGHPTLNLQSLSFRHTIDRSSSTLVGAALKELRARYHCVSNCIASDAAFHRETNTGSSMTTMTRALLLAKEAISSLVPAGGQGGHEGFLIELNCLNVRVSTRFRIADTVADEAVQMQALVSAMLSLPGRWIPDGDDFKRLFRSSTTYEHILFGDIIGPQPAPKMWVKLREMDMSLGDDPMEAWLERACTQQHIHTYTSPIFLSPFFSIVFPVLRHGGIIYILSIN
jgi:hypothetical protein